MEMSSFRQKSSMSKIQQQENSESQSYKNLVLLTTQVERLTAALKKKTTEVEQLKGQIKESDHPKSLDVEELINTVEEQTREIEKWADKYQSIFQQNQQLLQQNTELKQIVALLQNHSQTDLKSSEMRFPSQKKFQTLQESDTQEIEKLHQFYLQKLTFKQEEINQFKLSLEQAKQELLEEKALHRELMSAEEGRVREQERKTFNQYKSEMKDQLLLYKNQINALQDMLDNKSLCQIKDYSEDKIRNLNLQLLEKNRTIEQIQNEVQQKDRQISQLQQQLEKYQKEQVQLIKQSQKLTTLPCQRLSSGSGSLSLDVGSSQNNVLRTSSIQDQINQTMAQINRSIQQVDQMKQTNSVNQKIFTEELKPVTGYRSSVIQVQSGPNIQDKIKAISQLTQQSQYSNKFIY